MLKHLRERWRYALDELFAQEISGQLIFFVGLVFIFTAIGMTAVFFGLFSPENAAVDGIPRDIDAGFFDSLWWSLQLVLNLPGLDQTYGATWPIVLYSGVLSLASLAAFAILISLVRTIISRRLEALRQGDTPVVERDHIVLLYWSHKTIPALGQIAKLRPGSRVVILAPMPVPEIREELRLAGIPRLPLKVILRTGMPSIAAELARVAVGRASSVVVFAPESAGSETHSDSEVIKTMMLLAGKTDWAATRPTLIAEVESLQSLELATIAGRGEFQIVASSTVISKVIVQCIRYPRLSAVFDELFDPVGNSLYVEPLPVAGRTLAEVCGQLTSAIPIGVTWTEGGRTAAALNLEPDYEIDEDDSLILIAPATGTASLTARPRILEAEPVVGKGRSAPTPKSVLIIGWNTKIYDILAELNAHALRGTEITLLSSIPSEQVREDIASFIAEPLSNVSLSFRTGGGVQRQWYRELDLAAFGCIVVVADDTGDTPEKETDAHTLRVVLRLFDLLGPASDVHTVVELTDAANRPLLDGLGVTDIFASADIVSGELAQTARQPVLGAVYTELLRAGGVEISLRPVRDYLPEAESCTFQDLVLATQRNLETAIGLMVQTRVELNPDRQAVWPVDDNLMLVVLAQQLYV